MMPQGPQIIWPQCGRLRHFRVPGIRGQFGALDDAIRAAASDERAVRTFGPHPLYVLAAWALPPTDRSVEAAIRGARALLAARGIEL
jgi:hypothetical protein